MPFLAFGLVAGIAAPRLADWELARLVAQPLAERRLRRYGLSLLPRNFLRAVLVRTRLTAVDVVDPIERGRRTDGRRTDGRRTDGLASDIADGLDAEHGLHLLEQRFELDGRLWSRPQVRRPTCSPAVLASAWQAPDPALTVGDTPAVHPTR